MSSAPAPSASKPTTWSSQPACSRSRTRPSSRRARPEHHPAPLQRLPQSLAAAGRADARRRRLSLWLGHRLRGRGVTRRHPRPARTPGRFPFRSRAGADGWASGCSCSPARTSSTWTRRWAARCARTSGKAAAPFSVTGGRTCLRRASSACSRDSRRGGGLPVLDDGRVLDVRNVVWCTGFRPDFSWIRFPFEVGDDGYPVQYRGRSRRHPASTLPGCRSCTHSRRCSSPVPDEMPNGSRATS